jgi:hypothetical protein
MTTNRESLLDKMRALMAKTTANGCTEAEELAALAKVRALRDAHKVTDEELALAKDEAAILRDAPPDPNDPHNVRWRLAAGIEKFCDCKVWAENRTRYRHLKFVGAPADVDWAAWLLDHLTDFVMDKLVEHLCTSLNPERGKDLKGFIVGCTERIEERLIALSKPPADQTDNSRALVVIKSAAITAKLSELGIKSFRSCGGGCSGFDSGAYEAGREAGNGASFGRPVSGAAGVLRLGEGK